MSITGVILFILGLITVFAVQFLLFPEAQGNELAMQGAISLASAGVALAAYNPLTQRLQDRMALKQGDGFAYVMHALIFGGISFAVMVLGDGIADVFKIKGKYKQYANEANCASYCPTLDEATCQPICEAAVKKEAKAVAAGVAQAAQAAAAAAGGPGLPILP